MNKVVLKVSGDTEVGKLAGSISKNLDEGKEVEMLAIGASANNQAVKAIATARGHAGSSGRELFTTIGFTKTVVKDSGGENQRTAMIYRVGYC